ncbi:MAG TPA: hydrogenase expression/formation protein HypE [Gammaproteobacteria bacterium]
MSSHITLAHGNGGRLMRELIEEVFARQLGAAQLDTSADAVPLALEAGSVMITSDSFTVTPLSFPGGDIGSLAIHGTVNDLAVSGATPRYLTLNAIIEEGFAVAQLRTLIASLARTAHECGVCVVAGDTKVVPRGEGSGLYLATTGIGFRPTSVTLGMQHIAAQDRIIVSGPVGDHGTAVMLAREQFGLRGELRSDCASVLPLTLAARELPGVHFMRDPTRGGVATVMHEIARARGLGVRLQETAIPVNDSVRTVCEMLGYDPLFLACEGRVVAVAAAQVTEQLLQCWHALDAGRGAVVIGTITGSGGVVLETALGGERLLAELEEDPLPRIC